MVIFNSYFDITRGYHRGFVAAWLSGHEDQSHRDVVDRSEWATPESSVRGSGAPRQVWTGDLLASEVVNHIRFPPPHPGKCI